MRKLPIAIATASLLVLAGCSDSTTSAEPTQTQSETEAANVLPGPMADPDREPAPLETRTNAAGTAQTSIVDFGNIDVDGYVAPVRGVLVVPTDIDEPAPLIVVNHLRAPNCSDDSFAWPCTNGSDERRFDLGMEYLGERLAEQGYATLIPDLTPVWVSDAEDEPYSQQEMWQQIVQTLDGQLASDIAGESETFGLDIKGKIDSSKTGLVVHSRSVMIIPTAIDLFGEERLASVLGYGAAFNAEDLERIDPPLPDVPTLLLNGDDDGDVDRAANWWLTEHIQEPRTEALLSMQIPGYGHMFINRALQESELDDRIGCDERDCPDAKDHEDFLANATIEWINSTLSDMDTEIPISATDLIPDDFEGSQIRWLMATNTPNVTGVPLSDFTALKGETAQVCVHPDPMNPNPPANVCPEPEMGVITTRSEVLHLTGARADVNIEDATHLALHLLPFGTPQDGQRTELSVTLELASGAEHVLTFGDNNPALVSMASKSANGEYLISTIRTELPAEVASSTITGIRLESNPPVEVRAIDFVS
ncbi:hypothetical protein J2S70_000458 [Trueperella bonasi]|uniref:Alpha/beta hydrolase family protein n=1 Tax=Trueperella bonasi TaxID=312286 RepID=A0ABT9NER9_9ACTO|nr:hypothetical protein [Trueperella bonasi]MDP9805876.1 hypothetical protein [Trueperella bonasi]